MPTRTTFEILHENEIVGKLTLPDRVIFKGHTALRYPGAMAAFLYRQGKLLKDFGEFADGVAGDLKAHAQKVAAEAGRPFIYLEGAHTASSGESKEEMARKMAESDGIQAGLIVVFSVLETCSAFDVRGNHETHKREVVRRTRKCLHFYFYFMDPEFGFMHVRLQSWFPLMIQIYVNGREWLCRQLDKKKIGYERYDNALVRIDDLKEAERLSQRFMRMRWPDTLDRFAKMVNPWLPRFESANFGGYYWVTDQCEIATDVMFRDRAPLAALMPDIVEHTLTVLSAEDGLRFLGRKPNGHFKGEATVDVKRRPEGFRVKFRMKRNSIKVYDKWSVLRIETTINNPREFKVLRVIPGKSGERTRQWVPMNKGVANFWRCGQVGSQANHRFLEALGHVEPKRKAIEALDSLSQSHTVDSKHVARFNPVAIPDVTLFAVVLAGTYLLNGFRNRDIAQALYPESSRTPNEVRRRRERTSRLIAKLRGHGLIAKVQGARLYRVTPHGQQMMAAAVRIRRVDFPMAFQQAA